MKLFKKVLAGVAIAAAMASAQASPINVAGVTWDPDYVLDFAGFSSSIRQIISTDGSLSGFGYISTINNSADLPNPNFGQIPMLAPGYQLTYVFGGFSLAPTSVTPTLSGQQASYTGGWLNIFVDNGTLVNTSLIGISDGSGYGDGTPWLSLTARAFNGLTLTGTTTGSGASGSGTFDVVGGAAASNFDTNLAFNGGDIDFNSSFTQRLGNPNPYTNLVGNANFGGNSIPEPTSLALLGLGLLGVAAARRKSAK